MFVSPVPTIVKGFSYILAIVSHLSNIFHSHMPCSYMNHMWLGQFCDILPILQTACAFTLQYLSSGSKTSATFTNMELPPRVTIVFVDDEFSGRKATSGKTSDRSEVCASSSDSTSPESAAHLSAAGAPHLP